MSDDPYRLKLAEEAADSYASECKELKAALSTAQERIRVLEGALRKVEWGTTAWPRYYDAMCGACGWDKRAQRHHSPECIVGRALSDAKRGTE